MTSSMPSRPHQFGLSLVEFMIAITLGLLIMTAVTALFINQSKARSDLDKANRLIENGRYALELLSDDFRLAGFYGELDPSAVALPASLPDPCAIAIASLSTAVRLHVQGVDAATSGTAISSPPCALSGLKAGSDIVVLRRAAASAPVLQTAAAAGTPYLQASLCQYDTSAFLIDNVPGNLVLRQKNCTQTSTTPYANVWPYTTHVYFVAANNEGSDGIPTLKRLELTAAGTFATVPLVEGIEFLQIDYGIDNTGDGVVDAWSTCADDAACPVASWSNVVAVKINLLARNTEVSAGHNDTKTYSLGLAGPVGPFNDSYKRHAYSQVIHLLNPAGRRGA